MPYLVVDKNNEEMIFEREPTKYYENELLDEWIDLDEYAYSSCMTLPKGSIYKLIGRELTWNDEPVKI